MRAGVLATLAVGILALTSASATPCAAQGNVADELSETRKRLEQETVQVGAGEAKADRLMNEIGTLDGRLLSSGRNLKALQSEEAGLEKEYLQRMARLEDVRAERDEARERLAQRLASIYKRGRLGSSRVFAQAATSSEPLRMARYLAAVSKGDSAVFSDYERLSKAHEEELAALDEKREQIALKKEALQSETKRYETARQDKTRLLASVERDLAEHRNAAERLAAVELRLQSIMATPDEPEPEPERASKEGPRGRSRLSRLFRPSDKPFEELRGELAAPIFGQVLRRYGEKEGSAPGSKGVIVRASRDRQVSAVAAGEVVFSGPFPGLGKTLIVNHGGRYHSVYARLSSIQHEVGERVKANEVVGTLDQGRPELHFELRGEGKAIDPQPWLRGGYAAFSQ